MVRRYNLKHCTCVTITIHVIFMSLPHGAVVASFPRSPSFCARMTFDLGHIYPYLLRGRRESLGKRLEL